LGELGQISVAGDANDFDPFPFDRLGQGTYAKPRGISGAEIFIDDDDRKSELHIENL
jgi:hypothetical protein